jgi:glycosyltransferase involved in cell wall biosynthesis
MFSRVEWLTYLRSGFEKNTREVSASNLTVVPMPDSRGGKSFLDKVRVVLSLPRQFWIFRNKVKAAQIVHTRGPSVPALIGIVWSFFDRKRTYWHKYAGEWNEPNSPAAYRLQRWLLKRLYRRNVRITVNGTWPGLHAGFVSLENPCLDQALLDTLTTKSARPYNERWKICFVGSLEPFKGAMRLAKALQHETIASRIDELLLIGDGSMGNELAHFASTSRVRIRLLGFRSREEIFNNIYPQCHFLVLPSQTEGFPKVVAEAAAHRCIPMVTNVSALGQYIQHGVNGFLLPDPSEASIIDVFRQAIAQAEQLPNVAEKSFALASKFTYERFRQRIAQEVLSVPA